MKPLHAISYKDSTRPVWQYIQVKDGKVTVLSPSAFVVIPAKEIFGEEYTDEFYLKKEDWSRAKMHNAVKFERKDNLITGLTRKNSVTGYCKIYTLDEIGCNYPDYKVAMYSADTPLTAVAHIGFDPVLLHEVAYALGCDSWKLRFFFYGEKKGIVIRVAESESIGFLMPVQHKDIQIFNWPQIPVAEPTITKSDSLEPGDL